MYTVLELLCFKIKKTVELARKKQQKQKVKQYKDEKIRNS